MKKQAWKIKFYTFKPTC